MSLTLGNSGRARFSQLRLRGERRKKRKRHVAHLPRADLLVQGNREALRGAQQRYRAVLRRAEAPGVVDRRELGPRTADRL